MLGGRRALPCVVIGLIVVVVSAMYARAVSARAQRSLKGELFKYGYGSAHVAFAHGDHLRHVILIGGLTDGLFATNYAAPLAREMDRRGWSTVMTLLSSSHDGYGTSSLDRDAEELMMLVETLGGSEYALVGHSTGSQDIVRFVDLATKQGKATPSACVLQAGVSDREALAMEEGNAERIATAEAMVAAGKADEIMPRATFAVDETTGLGTPITARRFLSFAAVGGDDDMFSWDLSDEALRGLLGHMESTRTLVLMSGADEYVPSAVDVGALAERLAAAMGPSAKAEVIPGADHGLTQSVDEAVRIISDFIQPK